MTEITLRAYIREIDSLIEQEKLDEAIAHCRHLLQRHPKYIECYRLLGKAYLEAKRFGDAADIFQRVLSTVPDDFVSHIGMSIVREDEGNLDSAIWHMERAFETNPANPAIQQELKRLIGRRDGFEPHKVRLTRGALARMYAHGELYPQAIAELQSALDEHSDRPDLQVLLTKLLWQTDQQTEAAEVSGDLLEKLPYCLQATRIMAAVLQQRGKSEEAAGYHRRLAQLDPYMAYTEAPMAEPARVDADSIVVQKLDWKPGQPLPSTEAAPADWAASLGLDEEGAGPGTGPLPSWLDDIDSSQAAEEPTDATEPFESFAEDEDIFSEAEPVDQDDAELVMGEPTAEATDDDADIPDWMQDAGWQESSGEVEEQPVSFSSDELDQLERGELPTESADIEEQTGDLEPAEIPGWLQGMAPGDEEEPTADDEELEAIFQAEGAPSGQAEELDLEQFEEDASEPEPAPESQDVPAWLDEGEPGATNTIMTWLGDRDQEDEEVEAIEPEAPDEDSMEEALPQPDQDEEVPSWLSGVAQAAADSESSEDKDLAEFRQQTSREQLDSEEPELASTEAGEVPDWLQSITGDADETDTVSADELEQMAADAEADLPWEAEIEAAEQDTIPQDEFEAEEDAVPDWLGGSDQVDELTSATPELAPAVEEPASEDIDEEEDWLAGLGEASAQEEEELPEEATWLEELSSEESSTIGAQAEATAPSWMEGLAEEDSNEDEVEARASSWLDDLSETLADTPAEPTEQEAAASLDWLDEAEEAEPPTPESSQDEELAEEEEDLSWLTSMETEQQPGSTSQAEAPTPAAELDEIDEEGVFDWLDQMAAQQDQEPIKEEFSAEEPQQVTEPEVSQEAPPETYEEGLDWLDRLSETRGIDADIDREPAAGTISGRLTGDRSPEAREPEIEAPQEPADSTDWEPEAKAETEPAPASDEPAEVPTWLLAHGEQELSQPVAHETPETDEEDVPDWLMQQAESEEPAPQPSEIEAEPAAEAPDWLQDDYEEPTVAAEPSQAQLQPDEAPDWLLAHAEADASETEKAEVPTDQPPSAEPISPTSDVEKTVQPASTSATEEEEVPEWLKSQAAEELPPAETEKSVEIEPEVSQREPDSQPIAGAQQEPEQPIERTAPPADVAQFEQAVEAQPDEIEPETVQPTVPPAQTEQTEEQPAAASKIEEPADATARVESPASPDELTPAKEALAEGDEKMAAEKLAALIKDRQRLQDIVSLLEDHLAGEPDAPVLWQVLGDAYMRLNKTDKAVRAYDRGMEESEVFDSARQALAASEFERAAAQYGMLIKNKKRLDIVIQDLEQAVEGEQSDPRIWQILGDAYMKADRIDDSIEAYRKGMDSV